jgi:hypothetical protein
LADHLDKHRNFPDRVVAGQNQGMTLCLAQLMAELQQQIEIESGVDPHQGFERSERQPISSNRRHRFGLIDVEAFFGKPDQIIGEMKTRDPPRSVGQGAKGLRYAFAHVVDESGGIALAVNRRTPRKGGAGGNPHEQEALAFAKQRHPFAVRRVAKWDCRN